MNVAITQFNCISAMGINKFFCIKIKKKKQNSLITWKIVRKFYEKPKRNFN